MASFSAPGKLILMGEHSAVFSRPALVGAVDRRLTVDVEDAVREAGADEQVEIDLPDIGHHEVLPWSSLLEYTTESRRKWLQFARGPADGAFGVVGDDPAHVVKLALGEAQQSLNRLGLVPVPIMLRVNSELPVGSGFGSSAAAAVAVTAAYLGHRGEALDRSRIDHLALEVERRQHGLPSGIDSAAVIRGGLLWAFRDGSDELSLEPVADRGGLLSGLRVWHSGPPREPTGAVVAAVRARVVEAPAIYEPVLDRMAASTRELRDLLLAGAQRSLLVEPIRIFEAGLEELGVVPAAVRTRIRAVEGEGGAAKVSGAGALGGDSAGSLLVYHPEPERIATWRFLEPYREVPVIFGAEGVREEVHD